MSANETARKVARVRAFALAIVELVAVSIPVVARAHSTIPLEPAPPAGAVEVRRVRAEGFQVYECKAQAGSTFGWVLVGPQAVLENDDGTTFGSHTPTLGTPAPGLEWSAKDGSAIVADRAHPLAMVKRAGTLPSLLLATKSVAGGGVLSKVRYVLSTDAQGGRAPDVGCDAAHAGVNVDRHFSAIDTFYR